MTVGAIVVDKVKQYHSFETTGGYIRAEQIGTEHSDLFNPILFSEIEINGIIYGTVDETVTALNSLIYTNEGVGGGGTETVTPLTDNGDNTFTYVNENSESTTIDYDVLPQYRNYDITQWEYPNTDGITIPNSSSVNLLDYLDDSYKTGITSENISELSVTEDLNGYNYIQANWQNTIEAWKIRIILEVVQNGTDFFRLILRRKVDDSIVSVTPITINSTDVPEDIITFNLITDIGGANDSYITGGFYLEFANNSGQEIELINTVNVWFQREYRKMLKTT